MVHKMAKFRTPVVDLGRLFENELRQSRDRTEIVRESGLPFDWTILSQKSPKRNKTCGSKKVTYLVVLGVGR